MFFKDSPVPRTSKDARFGVVIFIPMYQALWIAPFWESNPDGGTLFR
jgi:hypothetical protein